MTFSHFTELDPRVFKSLFYYFLKRYFCKNGPLKLLESQPFKTDNKRLFDYL